MGASVFGYPVDTDSDGMIFFHIRQRKKKTYICAPKIQGNG